MDETKTIFKATGRRKEAVARVTMIPAGKGKIVINGRDYLAYFSTVDHKMQVKKPLVTASLDGKADIKVNVCGGGTNGQAGAISLGISRCLLEWNPELRSALRKESLLTRDPRAKERKKYGRKGARRRFQWTKR
ncbi:MAG: 30S ribosomal protein S9 [Candidatus Omnitrophica bacterium]|nr:30S ribosomal protein S9 [Candidatus Omnitrophota bacterium]